MTDKNLKKLNSRHEKFVEAVFDGEEIGKAYSLSFGEDEKAALKAKKLLSDPLIKMCLKEKEEEEREKERRSVGKTRERIIRELESVAFADINDFYPFLEGNEDAENIPSITDIPREKRGAISSLTKGKGGVTIKLNDKFKAIELLEKELDKLSGEEAENAPDDEIKVSIRVL